ncbi:MAG: formate dehydrogenase subunit delta [Qipengyuania sp.]|jgi:formate dehydrogenase subunit delta|nr:formate dehydrogenase subunit delta [Qipengyuania sp.]
MSGTAQSVVRMANQIARNFAHLDEEHAALATADHIAHFWDPRLRAISADLLGGADFSPVAERALRLLATGNEPPPQTRATEFNAAHESGGSDAG